MTEEDITRIKVIVLTLVITVVLSVLLKEAVVLLRPCEYIAGAECPWGYAFPSFHTSTAFSFVFPLFGHALFPFIYAIAILVGLSRVLLLVHTWYDIAGGIAVAALGYNIAECILCTRCRITRGTGEHARQGIHATLGVLLGIAIWFLGIEVVLIPLIARILVGILIVDAKVIGLKVPLIDQLLHFYEREGALPGEGSFYFGMGTLFTLGLLRFNPDAAIAVILILSLGDALATSVGTHFGRHKLPWNRSKSLEGSIGFFVGGLSALIIYPVPVTV
ncbi:MAG TPA: phosphatase PAP2 family protein, partial [Methanomicrobiales archaeon]|nr:phosphatase PAP2 family protein [Methanomicrobiales archaeon]